MCTLARNLHPSCFFFSSRRRHTRWHCDWSSDVCSSDLDGAGTGGDHNFGAADFYTAAEIDDSAFGLELAAGQLEGLRDAHDFAHAFEQLEIAMVEVAMDADGAEDGVRFAGGTMNVKAAGDEAVDDMLDLGVGGPFLHHDDHGRCLLSWTFR